MRKTIFLASAIWSAALLLAGCGATTTLAVDKPTVVYVKVPVPVACVSKDFPARPVFPDTPEALKAAKDFAERDRLVKGAWGPKNVWIAAAIAQIDICR